MSESEFISFAELRIQMSAKTHTLMEMIRSHRIPLPYGRDAEGGMIWRRETIRQWRNKSLPAETDQSEGRPMSIFEVAAAIGRTLAETRAMIADGTFAPGFLSSGSRRWHFADVQRYLDQQADAGK